MAVFSSLGLCCSSLGIGHVIAVFCDGCVVCAFCLLLPSCWDISPAARSSGSSFLAEDLGLFTQGQLGPSLVPPMLLTCFEGVESHQHLWEAALAREREGG
eukprot:5956046-Amphidinium_carterae.2